VIILSGDIRSTRKRSTNEKRNIARKAKAANIIMTGTTVMARVLLPVKKRL